MANERNDTNKKLDEMIAAYGQASRVEDEASRQQSLSNARHKADLEEDRQRLIDNGVPIDPELVKQVAGDDKMPIQKPKQKPTQTMLQTSTGDVIDTRKLDTKPEPANKDDQVNVTDDNANRSGKVSKHQQEEIDRVLNKAKRKYGKRNYNRLDPTNYTDEQIAKDKKKRWHRRIIIAVSIILVVALAGTGVGYVMYQQAHPPLTFKYSVCSEQDVLDAVQHYRDNDVAPITSYIDQQITSPDYTNDAKCIYIGILEFKLKGVKDGAQSYLGIYAGLQDAKEVDRLLQENGGPSTDDLKGEIEKMAEKSANNTATDGSAVFSEGGDPGETVSEQ